MKTEKLKKLCKVCGKEMFLTPYKFEHKEYCSNECKYKEMTLSKLRRDEEFKERVKKIYGDKITLLSRYTGVKDKVSFICNICNTEGEVRADKLLEGRSCKVCSGYKYTLEAVKNIVKEKYNDEYEILSNEFIDVETPITIKHNVCGNIYNVRLAGLLQGNGCLECYGKRRRTTEEFKELVKEIDDEYEVLGEYINNQTKILMKHNKCGETMYITPSQFTDVDTRCQKCNNNSSKGERVIEDVLLKNEIRFEKQKKFEGLVYKRNLSFDFYLEDYNLCIEFNGSQHYKSISLYGGDEGFGLRVLRDAMKQAFCEDKGINLLVIPFWKYREIEDIILKKIEGENIYGII